jgi:class III cytochrome C family protein
VRNTYRVLAVIAGLMLILAVCSISYAAETAPGTVVLKGAPMGGVKFDHKAHEGRGAKCDVCHHASKSEKPLASAHQNCQSCHSTTATAPMKTKAQAAFHNPAATAGVCIDCHKAENAKGKKAPVKCMDCHKKENA